MDIHNVTVPTLDRLKYGKLLVGLAPAPLSLVAPGVILNRIKAAKGVMIRNMSDHVVYVGDENVSIETGFPVSPTNAIVLPCDDPEFIYLVAGDADCECRWILV
jgi:hypothetical protein